MHAIITKMQTVVVNRYGTRTGVFWDGTV